MSRAKRRVIYGFSLLLALLIVTAVAIVVFLIDLIEGFTTMALMFNLFVLSEAIYG